MAVEGIRRVIDGVVSKGSVVSHLDGSTHDIFPVAIPQTEGAAVRDWVIREGATRTVEIGLTGLRSPQAFEDPAPAG